MGASKLVTGLNRRTYEHSCMETVAMMKKCYSLTIFINDNVNSFTGVKCGCCKINNRS